MSKNEDNDNKDRYRFILYSFGTIIQESNNMSLTNALEFYNRYKLSGYGIRLFKNGKQIPYADTEKELGINNKLYF